MKVARWRKQPNETGLRSIGQAPRGLELRLDGEVLIHVAPRCRRRMEIEGWYWYGLGNNTYNTKPLFETMEAARIDAAEFYKAQAK